MNKIFLFALFILSAPLGKAQVETDIYIGDTVVFGKCTAEAYKFIDLYTKTRWEDSVLRYDAETGEGYYEAFFKTGDFDVRRLPCVYAGTKAVVRAARLVTEPGGKEHFAAIAEIEANKKVVWIEEDAFTAGEVQLK